MDNIAKLLYTQKTVFTFQELKTMLEIPTEAGIKSFLQRAKDRKILLNPYKGYWTLPHYNEFELACAIKSSAYISCETVLFREAVFFQFYGNTISCMADDSRKYTIDDKYFIYYQIKSEILHNPIGIREYEGYRIATPERALCDYIYLKPHGVIDAPESINQIRLAQILPFYPKQTALHIYKLLNAQPYKT